MFARVITWFDSDNGPLGNGLLALIRSDYVAYYREKDEPPRRLALLFIPRLAYNACLHATVLIRIGTVGPGFMLGLWRTLLIAKHSIDIQRDLEIGPGLVLPHPLGIVFGWGVRIGSDATILHNVTIGGRPGFPPRGAQMSPIIGDRVTIYTQSLVVGPITIGDGAVIGARSWVDKDVPSGDVVRRSEHQPR